MLKHRIIPCVLLKDWQLTKSVQFKDYRTIGHPKVTARIYNARNVDELIVLDIDASKNSQEINYEALKMIAEECFMPLTIGGGLRSLIQVKQLLALGADKVALNTGAIDNPQLISEIVEKYGSQCVVVSIDVRLIDGQYKILSHGKEVNNLTLEDHLANVQKLGAGEILLTSVDRDGMQVGYDLELMNYVKNNIDIPVILNGGAGRLEDFEAAILSGADALAAASIFHFSQFTPNDVKEFLYSKNIKVRRA